MRIQIGPVPGPASSRLPAVLERITRMERLLFGVDAWSTAQVGQEVCGPNRVVAVASHEGRALGYVVLNPVGDAHDLHRIGVDPDWRRLGLARRLFAAVDPGGEVLLEVAETNGAALGLYTSLGFEEIGRRPRYYRDGSAALVLRRAAHQRRAE